MTKPGFLTSTPSEAQTAVLPPSGLLLHWIQAVLFYQLLHSTALSFCSASTDTLPASREHFLSTIQAPDPHPPRSNSQATILSCSGGLFHPPTIIQQSPHLGKAILAGSILEGSQHFFLFKELQSLLWQCFIQQMDLLEFPTALSWPELIRLFLGWLIKWSHLRKSHPGNASLWKRIVGFIIFCSSTAKHYRFLFPST